MERALRATGSTVKYAVVAVAELKDPNGPNARFATYVEGHSCFLDAIAEPNKQKSGFRLVQPLSLAVKTDIINSRARPAW